LLLWLSSHKSPCTWVWTLHSCARADRHHDLTGFSARCFPELFVPWKIREIECRWREWHYAQCPKIIKFRDVKFNDAKSWSQFYSVLTVQVKKTWALNTWIKIWMAVDKQF
jgi:hypothetical protein